MSPTASAAPSQTLARGVRVLEFVTQSETAPTIADIAAELGVHRSIVYRILRTLEECHLLRRDAAGRVHGAPGLAVLARRVEQDLQAAALPELHAISADVGMSAFLAVWDTGADAVTLVTVEPRTGNLVTQRPGTRHPLGVGGPGRALVLSMDETMRARAVADGRLAEPEDPRVTRSRRDGYATSVGEVIAGVSSVAVPLPVRGQLPACLAVVYATAEADIEAIAARLQRGAEAVALSLGEQLQPV